MSESDTAVASAGTAALIDTAIEAAEPNELEAGKQYSIVVPAGAEQKILDTERFLAAPTRPRGTYEPADVESFINYVEPWKADQLTVWVHPTEGTVIAVLNDSEPGEGGAGWGDHRAKLALAHSPEWQLWAKQDGTMMSQEAFAQHLREGMPDITEPDAATLIEIAESFESTTGVHFRSKVDYNSTERKFKYDETVQATATTAADGEIAVPRQFKLTLAPFLGEEAVEIVANLIHSSRSGQLQIGYKLERPERAVEDALNRVAERLADRFERVYRGTPAGTVNPVVAE